MRQIRKLAGFVVITVVVILFLWWFTAGKGLGKFGDTEFAPAEPSVTPDSGAATLTIPHTFSSGGTIRASDFNDNFTAVRDIVNNLDDDNISTGGITGSTKLADGTVTLVKLATSSVDSLKIVNDSVASTDILDETIVTDDIAVGGIATGNILDDTILADDIAEGGVSTSEILDDTILAEDFDATGAASPGDAPIWSGSAFAWTDVKLSATACYGIWMAGLSDLPSSTSAFEVYSPLSRHIDSSIDAEPHYVPTTISVSNLRVNHLGTTGSFLVELRANGSAIISCTDPEVGPNSCTDAGSGTVSAGQYIDFKVTCQTPTSCGPSQGSILVSFCTSPY